MHTPCHSAAVAVFCALAFAAACLVEFFLALVDLCVRSDAACRALSLAGGVCMAAGVLLTVAAVLLSTFYHGPAHGTSRNTGDSGHAVPGGSSGAGPADALRDCGA